ncbi:MAG: glycoside hydrolase family 3 protein [Acidobacteria bacterium]|nr:glycoside hydrolase family 3 protein [Acidobacteriota bacterium]
MPTSRRHFLAGSIAAYLGSRSAAAAKPALFTKYEAPAKALLAKMSLDEKVGQMTQPDQMYLKSLDDIEKYHLGSLLSGGDSDPKSGNDLNSWTEMIDRYQARALKTRLRIPLVYGIDSVHGNNNVIGATVIPHNVGLGCTRNAKLVERTSEVTAAETRAIGANWAFAPCVATPQDVRWGRTYEGYSESPDVVKVLGEAATRGLQRGFALDHPLAVLACSKHYAGDGGTSFGTGVPTGKGKRAPLDQGDTRMDEATLRRIHLQGYFTTVAAGVGSIMPSYSSWNGEKCSGHKRLLTDILKVEMGFEGFLISDYKAINQLPGNYAQQVEKSINAGMDMVMVPEDYVGFFNTLKQLTQVGKVPMARIDDAVTRILKVKLAMGLMDPKKSPLADRTLHKSFGSAEHRAIARQAVRESIVLLKNDRKLLPIAKAAGRIHVGGKCADNIGNQCGGWTIQWQGKSPGDQTGTTILAGLKKSGAQVTFALDGSGGKGAKVGVAVIGETPYAEMMGDRDQLKLAPEDVAVVDRMKADGLPVVAVIVSGRPLAIDAILGKADAIVAAWLPGTEGDGVADVLLGAYKPTGKLAFTWPSAASTSYKISDAGYKKAFAFGYGMSY